MNSDSQPRLRQRLREVTREAILDAAEAMIAWADAQPHTARPPAELLAKLREARIIAHFGRNRAPFEGGSR